MNISIKMGTYAYWLLSFVFVFIVMLTIYFFMGGFDEVKISKSIGSEYSIAGKWLDSSAGRKEEGTLFNEIGDQIRAGKLKGVLCMVDYKTDSLPEGEIKRFIGALLSDEISAIPPGFKVLELSAPSTYQAALTMHPLVMPNTQKVEERLVKLATLNEEALEGFTVELYFEDNSVIVEMFAKSN